MIFYILFIIYSFLLGTCIGSFLNVVIYRQEQEKNITGRSMCPHCGRNLSWRDLIPVLSFIYLKGSCRYCSKKMSIQYPLVEISTGVLFALIFVLMAPTYNLMGIIAIIFMFYIWASMLVIFVYDLKHFLIPDGVLLPAIFITALLRIVEFIYSNINKFGNFYLIDWSKLVDFGLGGIYPFLFFLMIFLMSKGRWMGFGDVKLVFFMGILLGLKNVIVALFFAFFLGAIIGMMLMLFKGKNIKTEIPFGPFLITGTFVALFWGSSIASWYLSLLYI